MMDQSLIEFFKSSLSCTICLELFTQPHTIQCGHTYCGSCLLQWLDQRLECPMCRAEIRQEPVPNLIMMEQIEKLSNVAVHRIDYGWRKYIKHKSKIRDEEDGVDRCMFCHWEIIEDECRCNSMLDTGNMSDTLEVDDSSLLGLDDLDNANIAIHEMLFDMYDEQISSTEVICSPWCECYECMGTDCSCSDASHDLEYYGSP